MSEQRNRRERLEFDHDWYFHKGDLKIQRAVKAGLAGGLTDDQAVEEGDWLKIAYSDKRVSGEQQADEWKQVRLPHDWLVEEEYSKEADFVRGFIHSGVGYYRKMFTIPEEDVGKKILLEFDGVMRNSTVWVNGHLIGTHLSGYTSFHYDVTDVLRYGSEGRNVILVRVDATDYEGWWYDGAGIYRHVWLMKTDRLHVAPWGTYVTTPQISRAGASVSVQTTVQNENSVSMACELITEIRDQDENIVATTQSNEGIRYDESHVFHQELHVSQPELWSIENPYLYKVMTRISSQGIETDRYETSFGIRSIEFTSDRGFLLNEKHVPIKGVCCHQNFAGVGAAMPDRIIEYRLELLKEMGFNAYRSAHHPPTPELLDMCDRMGILVVDENRRLDSTSDGVKDLTRMILRDRNHPSVIMWSLENEEDLQGTVMGSRVLETLVRTTRKLDPTRPTTAAMNKRRNEGGYSDLLDVVGYNYGQTNSNDVNDHTRFPHRKIIGSESAAFVSTRGIYEDDEEKGYCSSYGTKQPFCAPDTSGWCTTPERAWGDVVKFPFLTGVFIWTGFDYRGEQTPYQWPCINSHFGIMDMCGFPKDCYFYYRSAWRDEPLVHIFPHWNWHGKEGQLIDVWAYTNCDSVELFLNGESIGEQSRAELGHLEWKIPYSPGQLTAIGRNAGVDAVEQVVATTGEPHHIELDPDRTYIQASGVDVSVVRVSVRDQHGNVVPTADNEIRFAVTGPGKIIGVGNGDPSSHEPDKASQRRAFNGYCLVLIQSTDHAGEIHLTATSQGLHAAQILLESNQ